MPLNRSWLEPLVELGRTHILAILCEQRDTLGNVICYYCVSYPRNFAPRSFEELAFHTNMLVVIRRAEVYSPLKQSILQTYMPIDVSQDSIGTVFGPKKWSTIYENNFNNGVKMNETMRGFVRSTRPDIFRTDPDVVALNGLRYLYTIDSRPNHYHALNDILKQFRREGKILENGDVRRLAT